MSGKSSRTKGSTWELAIAARLREYGYLNAHRELEKRHDIGDIADGPADTHIEAKNHKQINLAGFIDQAVEGAERSGKRYPVVIVKRRQRPVDDAYAVLRFSDLMDLLAESGR